MSTENKSAYTDEITQEQTIKDIQEIVNGGRERVVGMSPLLGMPYGTGQALDNTEDVYADFEKKMRGSH